jgi:hypothetical protein
MQWRSILEYLDNNSLQDLNIVNKIPEIFLKLRYCLRFIPTYPNQSQPGTQPRTQPRSQVDAGHVIC